jgi:thiol-disulfide isomerase/thioredoxin
MKSGKVILFSVLVFAGTLFILQYIGGPQESAVEDKIEQNEMAPELIGVSGWLNSEALTLSELRGQVVLISFWTYTCSNCIREIPHLNGWHEKYADEGLVIIGVHTPEFAFEKDRNNLIEAVERLKIEYPVVQDNDYDTWKAYQNRYWPRRYIIDVDGKIRNDWIGEGRYEETEESIEKLLQERSSI